MVPISAGDLPHHRADRASVSCNPRVKDHAGVREGARRELLDVLADGEDLAEHIAVRQPQRRALAARVHLGDVGRLAVLPLADVDLLLRDRVEQALLGQEHADDVGVGPVRVVEQVLAEAAAAARYRRRACVPAAQPSASH